ncbi:LacI family DNA-binding transcriptional regulator [Paenibacillus sp. HJGM_3]|uniref:LacI family DNA-binding transcriptional regulator n=1 Tax=Paenibacillus sp. HJGM_3 TaxID=3379816 RepID=UPI00385CE0C1
MVTIKDIAREAGVTFVTVSRALNDEPGVSEEKRQAIKKIADRMNYVPSLAAKKLAQKQPSMLGMIWPKLKGLFFYDLSFEIQKEAARRGLQVIFSMAGPDEAMRTFNRYFVDYVVYWRPDWNPTLEFLQEKEKFRGEMLLLGGWRSERAHSLAIDRIGAVRNAVGHLADLGHRRVAFIGQTDLHKFNGYMQGLAAFKLDYRPEYILDPTDPSFKSQLTNMMGHDERPSAIVVDSQGSLFPTTRLLRELNIRVPEQVSLVVYDDIPELEASDVPLTTAGPSIEYLAKRTLDILTREASEKEKVRWVEEEVVCSVSMRGSTIPWKG